MTITTIPAKDTVRLMNKALIVNFPNVAFSVRTKTFMSGAVEVIVTWTEGPTRKAVDAVTTNFESREPYGLAVNPAGGLEYFNFGVDAIICYKNA